MNFNVKETRKNFGVTIYKSFLLKHKGQQERFINRNNEVVPYFCEDASIRPIDVSKTYRLQICNILSTEVALTGTVILLKFKTAANC